MTYTNNQTNLQFTETSVVCISNAIVLTQSKWEHLRPRTLQADEVFLWTMMWILDHTNKDIITGLLHFPKAERIVWYISENYHWRDSIDFTEKTTARNELQLSKNMRSHISDLYNNNITEIGLVSLIYISSQHISPQLKKYLKMMDISHKSITKKSLWLLHNPAFTKIWLFAFCDVLRKLWQAASLDYSDINMIDIHASDDVEVLDRDQDQKETKKKIKDEKNKLTIEHFAIDLTEDAKKQKLDPVIGRDSEIQQVIYTLMRKSKNNPLLLGEPWVWKTAIVEWLAHRIAAWDVPERLKKKRLMMLDIGSMVAWTKYRGEFEARFKAIMEEASDITNNIILFIDEIHGIIWAGWQKGTDDASQLIKPLLARGKIMLIWATTYDEYQQHIEWDAALKRRLQEINVNEPDGATTKQILVGLKKHYEDFHGVIIDDEALDRAIKLSQRYIMNKFLPDKALDIIDEAAARKSTLIAKLENDESFIAYEKDLWKIQKQIEKAIENQDYFSAAELKKKENNIKEDMRNIREQKALPHHMRPTVESLDIGNVLSDKTWIPAHVVTESEVTKLLRLEQDLQKQIVWQKNAISAVVKTLQRSRLSLVEKDGPIASFLFLWPSGTWKTSLAKLIAKDYFWDEKALLRFDMSEYMEQYSVSKLIWSAPGYVWHEWGGKLTEAVRRKPYSVILLDEIEKASPELLNILLQILDDGKITDSKWREINFKSTIIIMTSNLWHEEYSKEIWTIGFAWNKTAEKTHEELKERVMTHVKNFMAPELLNRINYKVVFEPLNKEVMSEIFDMKLQEFLAHWKHREDIKLPRYTKKKKEQVINDIYDPQYGARPIMQYIHDTVENDIIQQIVEQAKKDEK